MRNGVRSGTASAGRRDRSRGAAAVETAIVFPLIVFVTLGIIEFGSFWQRTHSINEAARAGARLAATMARELDYEDHVEDEVTEALATLPTDSIKALTIYKADPDTGQPFVGTVSDCTQDCFRYTWDEGSRTFTQLGGQQWNALDQAACGEEGHHDYIGIYVEGEYESLFGLFPTARTVSESTVLRLEPVPLSATCEP